MCSLNKVRWWRIAVVLLVAAGNADAGPADTDSLFEVVDPEMLPQVWQQQANERMMFPMRMADIAARIGRERQLFVDNALIGKAENVTRQIHQPVRSPHNPMLDDQTVWWLQHVIKFDESPRFRMWYNPAVNFHLWKPNQRIRFVTAYAVSEDGVNWERPDLGLYKIPKYPYGNVALPYGMMHGLFHEPWEPDPQKRFKAIVCVEIKEDKNGKLGDLMMPEGYYLHWSPDGIHWQGDLENMVIPSPVGRAFPMNGIGDTSRFWWDSIRKKYMGDVKLILYNPTQRCRGMMESDDLVHWTRPHLTFHGTEPNIQIYGHSAMVYEGMYIGFRWRSPTDYFWQEVHAIELALDCSRDGSIWTRVGAGQLFMERSDTERKTWAAPHAWDADQMAARSAFVVDDRIWLYYNGGGSVGLATLRRDGFASLNADDAGGTVVTRPLTFKGKRLHVNAEVAEDGELRVGFRTRDGKRSVQVFGIEECVPIKGDHTDVKVAWRSGDDVGPLSDTIPRIEFKLRNAKLYSFWFEGD